MPCVDLGESFPTHIFLHNLASIQLRTSPFKFARSPRTDPPGLQHERNESNVLASVPPGVARLERPLFLTRLQTPHWEKEARVFPQRILLLLLTPKVIERLMSLIYHFIIPIAHIGRLWLPARAIQSIAEAPRRL